MLAYYRFNLLKFISNERFFFPGVHHAFKFVLLGTQKGTKCEGFWASFRINPRVAIAPQDLLNFLADSSNLIYIQSKTLGLFNPDSLSVLEFKNRLDYEITRKMYWS
jgi:hypothetical protein